MTKILLALALLISVGAASAHAADLAPIRIGEINSYTALPLYTENYRKGWKLAVEEVNASGGINGRKIEVIDRDDLGKPEEAMRVAEELFLNEKINLLSGCMFGNVCGALGEFANKNKIPVMRWFGNPEYENKRESRYAFGLNSLFTTARAPALYVLEKHPDVTKWSSLAPNYVYGHQASEIFSAALKQYKPNTQWARTFWFPVGKLDAAATIGAIDRQQPDAVMNAGFGADITQLIRAGKNRDFDKGKIIVSLETGMPEYLDVIGAECPQGWIMTGYPRDTIDTPAHRAFVHAYEAKYGQKPGWMSLNGYDSYQLVFAALRKTPSLGAEDIVTALEGVSAETPIGTIKMRKADHFSTQGIWVGTSRVTNGKPELADWKYYGSDVMLIDESKVEK